MTCSKPLVFVENWFCGGCLARSYIFGAPNIAYSSGHVRLSRLNTCTAKLGHIDRCQNYYSHEGSYPIFPPGNVRHVPPPDKGDSRISLRTISFFKLFSPLRLAIGYKMCRIVGLLIIVCICIVPFIDLGLLIIVCICMLAHPLSGCLGLAPRHADLIAPDPDSSPCIRHHLHPLVFPTR